MLFQYLSKEPLNEFTDFASLMLSGSEFHMSIVLWLKNLSLILVSNLVLNNFCGPPLVCVL